MKKIASLFLSVIIFASIISGCNGGIADMITADKQIDSEVTDLQLALLNHIVVSNDKLADLEGKSLEGHGELVDDKFKKNISGGEALIEQLKGYALADLIDDNKTTGFRAAAFTKGNSLAIIYSGTETDDTKDFITDIESGTFDFSAQDIFAKAFAIAKIQEHKKHNVYISGYSLGGRLCYLGTEAAYDRGLTGNLKKVRTFNGLGVKEFIDFADNNLSNVHNLKVKFGKITYDYIVKGDFVSDEGPLLSLKRHFGYNHIGTEYRVPCTNKIDTGLLQQHDLYSVIDYLLNNPAPAENTSDVINLNNKPVLVVSDDEHNLNGSFVTVSGDTKVNTWNTFVSKYPQAADPMSSGREYFSKMHITLFFLKDNEGNVIDNKGFMNATGFGIDPVGWKDLYGEFDWMYTDTPENYESEDFYILYKGEYFSGPAQCHIINAKIREYVTMGHYEQDNNEENGKEPIDWLVLAQENDKMLVVSKYCLDYLKYPDDWSSNISWESCSLRKYLNSNFVSTAFSPGELETVLETEIQNEASEDYYSTVDGNPTKDRVFLLSIHEVQKYLPASTASESSKRAYGTDFLYSILQNHQAYGNAKNGAPVNWALRADIDTSRNKEKVGLVREIIVGDSQIRSVITTGGFRDPDGPLDVIRPAMWIKATVQKHR